MELKQFMVIQTPGTQRFVVRMCLDVFPHWAQPSMAPTVRGNLVERILEEGPLQGMVFWDSFHEHGNANSNSFGFAKLWGCQNNF